MQLAPVIARLAAEIPAVAGRVGVVATIKSAVQSLKQSPTLFVFAPRETGGGNDLVGGCIDQPVTVRLGVLSAVRNVADARGEAGLTELDDLVAAERAALLGWEPAPGCLPLEFAAGQLLYADQGWLIWQSEYRTEYRASAIYSPHNG